GSLVSARGQGFGMERTTVTVTDGSGRTHRAPLIFRSSERVDFQIPAAAAIGPAKITIGPSANAPQSADIRIDPLAPALFSANGDGKGVGAIFALHVQPHKSWTEPVFLFDTRTERAIPKPISIGDHDEQ